jgi:predicted metalloendopeptidase
MMQRAKLRAKEKLIGTKLVFGQQLTPMTDEYRHLKASISLDYIGNIISISNYTWDTQAKNLEKEKPFGRVDQEENNARYLFEFNEVHVKIGLIRELLDLGLSMDFPPSILYGSFVASTLGHELTHGFDNSGRKYEKNGYLLDWWEEKDKEAFDNRTQCLVRRCHNREKSCAPRWTSTATSRYPTEARTTPSAAAALARTSRTMAARGSLTVPSRGSRATPRTNACLACPSPLTRFSG